MIIIRHITNTGNKTLFSSISVAVLALSLIFIASSLITNAVSNTNLKPTKPAALKASKITTIVSLILWILFVTALIIIGVQIDTAKSHGMYQKNMPFAEMVLSNKKSPAESKVPEKLAGSIIIYYKYGCDDCEDIYEDLSNKVKDKSNVYWISTRSQQGKKLLKNYPVDTVPSAVYVRNDTFNGNILFTSKLLYTKTGNKAVIDNESLERLFYLQKEGR